MGKRIEIDGGGAKIPAYFANGGEVDRKGAGVVLLAGARGLTKAVEGIADRLAETGYPTVAPDLAAAGDGDATIAAALDHLRRECAGRLALWGMGSGATRALHAASDMTEVKAVVFVDGKAPAESVDLSRLAAAVIAHFGKREAVLDKEATAALGQRIKTARVDLLFHYYDAAAGFCEGPRDDDERIEAQDVWDRSRDFLNTVLT